MEQYNCPKCHCGSLFEDHGKLVCLNCGNECSKLSASAAVHTHSYETYTADGAKTVKRIPIRPAPEETRTPGAVSTGGYGAAPAKKKSKAYMVPVVIGILIFLLSMCTAMLE